MEIFAPYTGQGPLGEIGDELGLTRTQLARAQFLTWLKRTNPALFQAGLRAAEKAKADFVEQSGDPAALSGLGISLDADGAETVAPTTWWQSAVTGITALATASLAYKGQKAAIEMNMRRADQGLPPIDYSRYNAPTVRTEVDVSPEILARLREGGMNTMLLIGGAVLAFLLLPKLLGGKGRR